MLGDKVSEVYDKVKSSLTYLRGLAEVSCAPIAIRAVSALLRDCSLRQSYRTIVLDFLRK